MLLRIQVPESVYIRLKNGEDIRAITNFDQDDKRAAYEIISKLSGFDNFWFAMVVDNEYQDDIKLNARMCSGDNAVNLLIDVPESELYITNYYDFSDLIYFTAIEPDPETVETIIKRFKAGIHGGDMEQAIFPVLRHSYIKKKLK